MDEVKLLPCDHCGLQPKSGFMGDEDGGYGYVECGGSGDGHFAGVHADDEAEAIAVWNTRPTLVIDELVERVVNAIEAVESPFDHHSQCPEDCAFVDALDAAEQAVRSALAAMPTLGTGQLEGEGWQPIETVPKDGRRIHLGFASMSNFDVIAFWADGDWALSGYRNDWERMHGRPPPTAWRPLPEPPAHPQPGSSQ